MSIAGFNRFLRDESGGYTIWSLIWADDPKQIPRFPITIQDDIPFLLVMGYALRGEALPPIFELNYSRKHGHLRDKPLQPTSNPWAALEKLVMSPAWIWKKDPQRGRAILAGQCLWLLDSV